MSQRLKIWPEAFDQLFHSTKPFTIRRCDDRQFRVGEVLDFVRFDPTAGAAQDPMFCRCRVTAITRHAGGTELLGVTSDDKLVPMAVLTLIPMLGGPGEPPAE